MKRTLLVAGLAVVAASVTFIGTALAVAPTQMQPPRQIAAPVVLTPPAIDVPPAGVLTADPSQPAVQYVAPPIVVDLQPAALPIVRQASPGVIVKRPVFILRATGSVGAARQYALSQVGATQYNCLNLMWTRESNWNPLARNRRSGAYGIPQALPATKMASAGADWRTNPLTQVRWGLGYIRGRYGSPCGAWAFWLTHHWY